MTRNVTKDDRVMSILTTLYDYVPRDHPVWSDIDSLLAEHKRLKEAAEKARGDG